MRVFETEVSTGNASGKAGVSSIPFGRGFYQSGNNGANGVSFTPYIEPTFKSYKDMKHSKKNLKKKRKMKTFEEFLNEDATATAGNTGGMGAVVAAQPSSIPGDVAGGTKGSGDIGATLGTYTKTAAPTIGQKLTKKKKTKSPKIITTFANFNPMKESEEIPNNTARWFDNYDDEEDPFEANENNLKKIQMFEGFEDNITYEMSGSPMPYFKTKSQFVAEMSKYGYHHTTLTKKTHMLIVSDEELGTLKCQKAEKYGIPVYTYAYAKREMKHLGDSVSKYNL